MASRKNTNVYLEAVEAAGNEGCESKEIGNAQLAGIQKRKHAKRLIGLLREVVSSTYHNKQKTCTPWIL